MSGKSTAPSEREFPMRITPSLIKYIPACWGLALVSLHLCAALTGSSILWGVDSWAYFPLSVTVILFLAGLLFLFPPTARSLVSFFENTFARVLPAFKVFRGYPAAGFLAAVAGGLFWLLRCRVHLLGDGYWWIRNLEQGEKFWKNEPLSLYLNWLTHRLLNPATGLSAQGAFQLVSCVCGTVFVYVLFRLARRLGKTHTEYLLIFLSIATLGVIQLFFGYVETYPLLTVLVLIYISLAVSLLQGTGSIFWPALAFWLCVLMHLSAVVLAPSLGLLYLFEWKKQRPTGAGMIKAFAGLIGPVAAVGLVMYAIGLGPAVFFNSDEEITHLFLPFVSADSRYFSYGLLSAAHLTDLANLWLLISPWSLPLGLLIFARRPFKLSRTEWFLVLLSFFPLALCGLFNTELGFPRDWDIFAYAFIAPTLLGILLLIDFLQNKPGLIGCAAVAIVAVGMLHTAPWVLVNADRERSIARYENILKGEVLRSTHARAFGHEEIAVYCRDRSRLSQAEMHYRKAIEADLDSYRLYAGLASVHFLMGQKDKALTELLKMIELEPESLRAQFSLALFYQQETKYVEAERHYRKVLEINPAHLPAVCNLGSVYFKQGFIDKAILLYRYVLKQDPEDNTTRANLETALRVKEIMDSAADSASSNGTPLE